jgi:hypothetical protein
MAPAIPIAASRGEANAFCRMRVSMSGIKRWPGQRTGYLQETRLRLADRGMRSDVDPAAFRGETTIAITAATSALRAKRKK